MQNSSHRCTCRGWVCRRGRERVSPVWGKVVGGRCKCLLQMDESG
ncbi:hypothetical protein WQQ_42380 [Hydrocarboniphaga effusa AP103]|uniref:Uncharacterized protein n=1 Tax=Hydrocarboniphaga effusa AP103 TaxID=1172194 RepID=I8T296_9GAMM|nr:hypothetical protein WQQ_42380 [Hydrocarboniphaga effusa AP103]